MSTILEVDPPISLSIEHDYIWMTLGEVGKQGKSRIRLLGPAEARLLAYALLAEAERLSQARGNRKKSN